MDSIGGARPKTRDENPRPPESSDSELEDVISNGGGRGTSPGSYSSSGESLTSDYLYYTYKGDLSERNTDFYGLSLPERPRGISGPGQSNLSDEVAAIIQSELSAPPSRPHRIDHHGYDESPEMDFLEMDFDDEEKDDLRQDSSDNRLSPVNFAASGVASAPILSPASSESVEEAAPILTTVENGGTSSSPFINIPSSMIRSRSLGSPANKPSCSGIPRGQSDPGVEEAKSDRSLCVEKLAQKEYFLFHKPTDEDSDLGEGPLNKVMIWNELEACKRQVGQIGPSACGATSLINCIKGLNVPSIDISEIVSSVNTRYRHDSAIIPEYLFSRSVAGTTAEDLIQSASKFSIYGRFFGLYPKRRFPGGSLIRWLNSWLLKGGVPIVSLNLQKGVRSGASIPDSWHHQMVFGAGPAGVYLTNPIECVAEAIIEEQLSSPSELLIRKSDILKRWTPDTDLSVLKNTSDERWKEFNVLGQVINCLREDISPVPSQKSSNHIIIPAAYKSGVTIYMREDSSNIRDLHYATELPIAYR